MKPDIKRDKSESQLVILVTSLNTTIGPIQKSLYIKLHIINIFKMDLLNYKNIINMVMIGRK